MQRIPDIDIICPSCQKKAAFYGNGTESYNTIVRPNREGKAICVHCSYNASIIFTNKDYFYQIPVGNRLLYARTKENLILLRDFFKEKRKFSGDPDMDFPKLFYRNSAEIIRQINLLLIAG
jgi:hypothetical protein